MKRDCTLLSTKPLHRSVCEHHLRKSHGPPLVCRSLYSFRHTFLDHCEGEFGRPAIASWVLYIIVAARGGGREIVGTDCSRAPRPIMNTNQLAIASLPNSLLDDQTLCLAVRILEPLKSRSNELKGMISRIKINRVQWSMGEWMTQNGDVL